jgi:hypothetical protein
LMSEMALSGSPNSSLFKRLSSLIVNSIEPRPQPWPFVSYYQEQERCTRPRSTHPYYSRPGRNLIMSSPGTFPTIAALPMASVGRSRPCESLRITYISICSDNVDIE